MSNIKYSVLALSQIFQVKYLVETSRQKPYRFAQGNQTLDLGAFWMRHLIDLTEREQALVFAAWKDDEIVGIIVYADLPWETRVFAKRMGSLKYVVVNSTVQHPQEIAEHLLDEAIKWALLSGIEFLLYKAYTDDVLWIHTLEKKGFLLMDTQLDYVFDFRDMPFKNIQRPFLPSGFTIRLANQKDTERLVNVARMAFNDHFGRFHSDSRISKASAISVYEEWIKSSAAGYADWIILAEDGDEIAGYSVWKKPSSLEQASGLRIGHYSIGAVHPNYRGKGIFTAVTYAGMELLNETVDYIEGPTHINNYPVQNGYGYLSWKIRDGHHSFHKWLEK